MTQISDYDAYMAALTLLDISRAAPGQLRWRALDGRTGALLRKAGRPITVKVFPEADHGMYEFETRPDGERISTPQPKSCIPLMCDFIKGRR
jgi:hypothetical protein